MEVVIFGAVGLTASLTHFAVAVALIELAKIPISCANIVAFISAVPVSYFGHAFLTFSARHYGRESDVTRQSAGRFVVLAIAGFVLNQTIIVWFTEHLGYPHRAVLAFTILGVAGFLFLASKLWAFRGKRHPL